MLKKGLVLVVILALLAIYGPYSQGTCGDGACDIGETCAEDKCCDGDTYVNGYICCNEQVYFGNCCENSECLLDSCDYHRCVTCIEDIHCPECYECREGGTRQSYCYKQPSCLVCAEFSDVISIVNAWMAFDNSTQQVIEVVKGWKDGC